ncbi:glutaminase a [Pyrenophora seminiperda CCB06]|uniref:Glutaminase a n=1 Tax=Pyrenophora seminiperda CCB06 TaxID=1302712 RepID=A0A3M7LWE7_9PLEO|nr:glutaminase a [Pyrenophora seminiperda CCB06]
MTTVCQGSRDCLLALVYPSHSQLHCVTAAMHYRSITIGLRSQFDIETLPEYYPGPRNDCIARGITGFTPEFVDNETSTCSVYVPVYPGSTFWIGYSVSPPVPEGHYFLFKLYIDSIYVTSWSTGKAENWQGKTMFGLFETAEDENGKKRFEKRVLCFTPPVNGTDAVDAFDETACVEIRVHRADGRKRVERQAEEYKDTQHAELGKGISRKLSKRDTDCFSLVSAGRAGPEQPKRFYKFALIDPIDEPLATFRYYYRTWDQLRDLGLLEQKHAGEGEENDLSVIEPLEDDSCGAMEEDRAQSSLSSESSIGSKSEQTTHTDARIQPRPMEPRKLSTPGVSVGLMGGGTEQPRTYVPRGAPDTETRRSVSCCGEQAQPLVSCMPRATKSYCLPTPLSIKLVDPEQAPRPLPTIPGKSGHDSPTCYLPHPAYSMDDWNLGPPSPVGLVRDDISTPLLERWKEQGRPASALMGAIASAWRRRGARAADA